MNLVYQVNERVNVEEVVELIRRSSVKRNDQDAHRLVRIVPQANIVVAARDGRKLVGLVRGLRECSGCCYVSDLIVDSAYTGQGIGEQLIRQVHAAIGDNTLIVLVPSPEAAAYSAEID